MTHLFFADDSFIFFKAKREDGVEIRRCLETYERASGQVINYDKLEIWFGKNVKLEVGEALAGLLGVKSTEGHERYLGRQFFAGEYRREEENSLGKLG